MYEDGSGYTSLKRPDTRLRVWEQCQTCNGSGEIGSNSRNPRGCLNCDGCGGWDRLLVLNEQTLRALRDALKTA